MRTVNSITVSGNLGKAPEQQGNGPAKFSLCWNASRKVDGEWTNTPHWFDVISWDKDEVIAAGLDKGDRVVVSGRLKQETWQSKEGEKRSKVVIEADTVSKVLDKAQPRSDGPDW